jgi:hypothetical protein
MNDFTPLQPTQEMGVPAVPPPRRGMSPLMKGCIIAAVIFFGLVFLASGTCFYIIFTWR